MMKNQSFYRKITYAIIATVLLLPISFIARPASYDTQKQAISNGGVLSRLRTEKHLSISSISEIDSTSEIMKLGSLGLHGIAVNLLWNQAQKYEEAHAYDRARETIATLIKLQPHFVNVWEFQAHNLSYNISREFDDYEDRYFWVKEGIDFLIEGIPKNKRNKKILDNLGLFSGQKIGRSDEKKQFRELFRHDTPYHQQSILGYFDSLETVKHPIAGVDNWLWAKGWYEKSYKLVEQQRIPLSGELLYYSKASSQYRNFADSYMQDFPPSQYSQEAWRQAHDSWVNDYGTKTIHWSREETYTHEGQQGQRAAILDLRKKLDECAPGLRDQLRRKKRDLLTVDEREVVDTPLDLLRGNKVPLARLARAKIAVSDEEVANEVPAEKRPTAVRLIRKLAAKKALIQRMARDRQTVNYDYWRTFTKMASTQLATEAWAASYRAKLAQRAAKPLDYDETETVDGLPTTVKKKGAISHRIDAMAKWKKVFEDFPSIAEDGSPHVEDLVDEWKSLNTQIRDYGLKWPTDFPLQKLVDHRAVLGYNDGIPTTDQLRADGAFEKKDEEVKDKPKTSAKETKTESKNAEEKKGASDDLPPTPKVKKDKS